MRIILTSVMVSNQEKALQFYTNILGFIKKLDIPMGEHRWLTVTGPEGTTEVELLLEPMGFAPAVTFQKALFDAGIPATAFGVTDIRQEYERLQKLGVVFRGQPAAMGPVTVVNLEDTCGNLIQLVQQTA